jgi:cbb3-type cytochrome oxidase maturation protein
MALTGETPMETLLIVLPLALLFVAAALLVFRWAVRTGQFDDLDTPPLRMLFDDPPKASPKKPGKD